MAGDMLDVSLVDDELLAEVELMANLIVAAADAEGHLSPDLVDRLLFAGTTQEFPLPPHHPLPGQPHPRHDHRRARAGDTPGR
jgi:hypothetical protein